MEDMEMDELVSVMQDILAELQEMNSKLNEIKGYGLDNSISDLASKLDEIKGAGLYNSLSDVCDKIESLETTITLGDNY